MFQEKMVEIYPKINSYKFLRVFVLGIKSSQNENNENTGNVSNRKISNNYSVATIGHGGIKDYRMGPRQSEAIVLQTWADKVPQRKVK